ncbi:helix-turn-helix domain-containing protein [Microvirga sp. VF16]|uniref:helix-turn-helix domain-containing protein n=1 Tax=Microvirga sp. VF16 TaxID=2807101 RepID=UPI00193D1CC6|nr:helix-turn-helix domain-containing protein [Microvirga sp. VF16]QRM35963.1 helix-turn-helix domain-containing protein [Microvirga sp. VF16]
MSKESKKRSLSYRVTTPEERARRRDETGKRTERIMTLKAQGLNYATIGIRLGLSPSTVSRIAREYTQQAHDERLLAASGTQMPGAAGTCHHVKESDMSSHAQRLSSQRTMARVPTAAEALARELFKRVCRDDTFDDLKRRAAFNRQDAGRLRHWIRAAHAVLAKAHPYRP